MGIPVGLAKRRTRFVFGCANSQFLFRHFHGDRLSICINANTQTGHLHCLHWRFHRAYFLWDPHFGPSSLNNPYPRMGYCPGRWSHRLWGVFSGLFDVLPETTSTQCYISDTFKTIFEISANSAGVSPFVLVLYFGFLVPDILAIHCICFTVPSIFLEWQCVSILLSQYLDAIFQCSLIYMGNPVPQGLM